MINDYTELIKQKSDHFILINSETLMQIFNELLCMIVNQLERSFVYESNDHVNDDVCFSYFSYLNHVDFNDFKYEDSEVWMIKMNMNTTLHCWKEWWQHTETDSSDSSDKTNLKVNITSISNATTWERTVRLILQFLFSYFALLKIYH